MQLFTEASSPNGGGGGLHELVSAAPTYWRPRACTLTLPELSRDCGAEQRAQGQLSGSHRRAGWRLEVSQGQRGPHRWEALFVLLRERIPGLAQPPEPSSIGASACSLRSTLAQKTPLGLSQVWPV